ncbi:response regulator transcription factor [Evansella cellulosilytica]|uniref:Two component transcriptional regulator, winged helix family n=1 Tax=Evansella cellulosilytica (strain ATCC 21833 / DSM 2522 / FERM P-1141 / JCM 9156 / N-4) TaxID=649639 RepID=E6U0V4_EVAC2|nr:response regulator transcription factor [Evansella cellulosilytica]ADU30266.1 two component transcriptional regulator, winged helix family [Evansella cellulosilytica DSM 2522]
MSNIKVLVADDDPNVCEIISLYLKQNQYDVVEANNGKEAISLFESSKPDIILLDIMMPDIDGYEVCKEIRKKANVPIIMLTAKDEELDRVLGLEIGADDYVTKPFSPREVVARIKAIFRRMPALTNNTNTNENKDFTFSSFSILVDQREVIAHGEKLFFRPKEFDLLLYLVQNPQIVFTREQLLQKVWGFDFAGDVRTVDVHIKRIRDEFAKHQILCIHTVWGVGYQFHINKKE